MVFIWYLLPTQRGGKSNFLAPLICPEQKLTRMTRELFYEHEKHRMNGNFFAKPNKLRKSVSFVISVFKKEKGKQIYPIYLKKLMRD